MELVLGVEFIVLELFNNGFIIQYGSHGTGTVTYPIAFTKNGKVCVCPNGGGANPGSHIDSPTLTSFYMGNGNNWGMHWISVGY